MPELPEVETLTNAVKKIALGRRIIQSKFYRKDLRSEIPVDELNDILLNRKIIEIRRRSKFMMMRTDKGWVLIHLGMSGHMDHHSSKSPQLPHTHVVFTLEPRHKGSDLEYLHYVDPRRFGWMTCTRSLDPEAHELLRHLGPEPLETKDLGDYLWRESRGKTTSVKSFIMNAKVVVGVGNIYANEALFRAGIRPGKAAGRISRESMKKLAVAIAETLRAAISQGGTTLRDFRSSDGSPGYFAVDLQVYGRGGETCLSCSDTIKSIRQSNRASYYCPTCQR
ncbi:MAG: bifunctional DNA-formamidopyrimidine glycosylase/DNA-(apurinic or apyrimidinic site) lyase [Pseudobacteriovorax sp.]|nr:bifunctional DNA-formamidopyrimidine glycosylase/DNA-(apurinic or apyrimidinic site) lyase [Pseudobacteriovorax sp.]